MKTPFFIALALALPFALSARADDHKRNQKRQAPAQTQQSLFEAAKQQGTRNVQQGQVQQGQVQQGRMQPSNPAYPPHRVSTATRATPPRTVNSNRNYNRSAVNRSTSSRVNTHDGRFRDRSRGNNVGAANRVAPQRNHTDRHHGNRPVDRNSYNHARHRWVRTYHNRNWWRSHYNTTFVLFGGGYYYWDAGYWFPAYGYDPYYNNYLYNEPIYGYNDLAPGDVLENVQIALRDAGYYNGAIDGLIGPQTRAALGAFQRDNGLIITEAVDEPTLDALGLT